jgi:hypothetical protein
MDIDVFYIVVGTAIPLALLLCVYLVYWQSRGRKKRQIAELLKGYFQGDISAEELRTRTRATAGRNFAQGEELYALVVSAFQNAIDAKMAQKPPSKEDEKKLMGLLAALKKEFGLADLYRIEGWRAGRE